MKKSELAMSNYYSGSQESEVCLMPHAPCPMPHAPCPMPYARRVPHVTEKGYSASSENPGLSSRG